MGENSFDKETVALIAESATSYYDELRKDPNGRFRSWEHCYSNFYRARQEEKPDIDYLSLQLAFYLASWGMYRGSSFLLQKDYRIHTPVVEEILEDKYDVLLEIECFNAERAVRLVTVPFIKNATYVAGRLKLIKAICSVF